MCFGFCSKVKLPATIRKQHIRMKQLFEIDVYDTRIIIWLFQTVTNKMLKYI